MSIAHQVADGIRDQAAGWILLAPAERMDDAGRSRLSSATASTLPLRGDALPVLRE